MSSPLKQDFKGSALKSSKKSFSPIKVMDYFANPLHKIKQPAFVQVGFTDATLNTFVKAFTNRNNNKYISFTAIRDFIKSFTNNSPRLIKTYQDFFFANFKINQEENITLESFIQFFMKEDKPTLKARDEKALRKLYNQFGDWTAEGILAKAQDLQIIITQQQAQKIIKMVNYSTKCDSKQISEEAFIKIMR